MGSQESGIQTAICHYLAYLENQGKLFWFRANSFSGFIQRANGSLGRITNSKKGLPDIIVLFKGRFIGLEVKSAIGKQSPDQKQAQKLIEACGGEYYIVRSVTDVETLFR